MGKTTGFLNTNVFKASRRVSFSHFPKVVLDHVGDDPGYLLEFLWIVLQYSIQAQCKI